MKAYRIAAATLALGTSIAVAPGLASANKKHPHNNGAAPAAKSPHTTKYIFRGLVVSTPVVGNDALVVDVRSGNKAGVTLVGATPSVQTFHLAATSQLFSWNAAGTTAVPTVATSLQAGDPIAVTIMGPSKTTLATLLSTVPVNRVDDVLNSSKPAGRIFIYVAKVLAQDPIAGTVTVNVVDGNWRAMHSIAGQSSQLTFHYSTASTVFLNFNGKGKAKLNTAAPTFAAGSTITIRVFSANYQSDPASLTATPAWRINAHEPARMVRADIKKHNDHKM